MNSVLLTGVVKSEKNTILVLECRKDTLVRVPSRGEAWLTHPHSSAFAPFLFNAPVLGTQPYNVLLLAPNFFSWFLNLDKNV